jgi:hypothetical protein
VSSIGAVRRLPIALLLVALLAGCGTATKPVGSGGGAAVAPKSTALLLRLDTSFDSPQWQALETLLGLFPDGKALLSRIGDVKQALGPETDVLALSLADLGSGRLLGLTQPRNPADLETLLAKRKPPQVSEEIESWRVIAHDRPTIDRFKQARNGGSLLDSDAYTQATNGLPADPLATVYVEGAALTQAIDKRLKTGTGPIPGLGRIGWLSGALTAKPNGFALDVRIQGDEIEAAPFTAELPAEVPADVAVYVDVKGLDATLDEFRRSAGFSSVFGSNAKLIGGLLGDTIALFKGEGAFYVRPSSPVEYTLVLKVADEQAATATLDRLATLVGALTQQVPEPVVIGDVTAKKVLVGKLTLYYAVFSGKLVVTTSENGISGLQQTAGRLAGSKAWNGAKAAAEMPGETTGIVYADVRRALPLLPKSKALPAQVRRNLATIGTALVYGSVDGTVISLKGFVSVR